MREKTSIFQEEWQLCFKEYSLRMLSEEEVSYLIGSINGLLLYHSTLTTLFLNSSVEVPTGGPVSS